MQRFVVYTPRPDESRLLLTALRSRVANNGDEVLDSAAFPDAGRAASALQAGGVQLIGWDVSAAPGRLALQTVRAVCREAFLLVIAEPDTSPLLFLTPGLRPDSLLLRPIRPPEARRAAEEMASELRRQAANVHQFIISPIEAHSKKPDEAREKIVALMGDVPRVELFARQTAPGWDVWGNEVECTPGLWTPCPELVTRKEV